MAAPFALRMEGGSFDSSVNRPSRDARNCPPLSGLVVNSEYIGRSIFVSVFSGSVYAGTFGALHPAPFFSPFRDCTFNSTECFETCTLASATAPSHPPGPVEPPKNPSHAVFSTITYLCATALRATLTGLFHQCHLATLSFYWQNASTQLSGASIQEHMEAFIPLAPNNLC